MAPPSSNPQTDPAQVSRPTITITFGGPESAELTLRHDPTLTDGQLFAAAWMLDAYAHEVRAAIVAAQGRQGLQLVPAGGLPAQLRGLGRND